MSSGAWSQTWCYRRILYPILRFASEEELAKPLIKRWVLQFLSLFILHAKQQASWWHWIMRRQDGVKDQWSTSTRCTVLRTFFEIFIKSLMFTRKVVLLKKILFYLIWFIFRGTILLRGKTRPAGIWRYWAAHICTSGTKFNICEITFI
jgi:hypothetical protein